MPSKSMSRGSCRGTKIQNAGVCTSMQISTLWLHRALFYITRRNQGLQTQLHLATKIHNTATLFAVFHPAKISGCTANCSWYAGLQIPRTSHRHKALVSAVFYPKFITKHTDLQPWHRHRAGQKVSALNAAAVGRTCLKKPVGRVCWAGAGARPGQAEGTGFRQV